MGSVYARISYLGGGGFDDLVMSPILLCAVLLWNVFFNLGYDFKGETRVRDKCCPHIDVNIKDCSGLLY